MSTIKVTNLKHESSSSDNINLDSSGRVGINTTSPGALLHLSQTAGNAKLLIQRSNTASNAGDYGSILWRSSGGSSNGSIGVARETGEDNGYMFFSTGSSGVLSERARITSTGDFKFNSGYGSVATAYGCRAWVNFNGTGTVAIRASGNVSSITDNGTGAYTVNFTTAMVDANYAHEAQGSLALTDGNLNHEAKTHTAATGSVKVRASNNTVNNTVGDQAEIRVVIFR
jgi:hypothetical protein